MSKGINIKMPFYHLNDKSVEIEITSENIIYSEIGSTHYGLQVNACKNYDEILLICKDISNKVKELNNLTKQI